MTENRWVQGLKIALISLSALGYTWPLLSGGSHIVVVVVAIIAGLCAALTAQKNIRLVWCLLISAIFIAIGLSSSFITLNILGGSTITTTLQQSRFWYYSGLVFGIAFCSRSLALRYRIAQLLEVAIFFGALVYIFFAHRNFNLNNPREFADMLYTNGYDPIQVYRAMGIITGFLALALLFAKTRIRQALYAIVFLALMALLAAQGLSDARLPFNMSDPIGAFNDDDDDDDDHQNYDDENDGDKGDDDESNGDDGGGDGDNPNDGKSNSNSNNNRNDDQPYAIAVFYDEFEPNDGIFHFRQTVLSGYDGNHLVQSSFDSDVISTLPVSGELTSTAVQNPEIHTHISTSMFLIKDHQQPPQLAMGQKVFTIQNPNPTLFVAAYGVESYGLTLDLLRLIGRKSIPDHWSQEKIDHYLQVPDDPRYRALSDIIVRNIDPRFFGDDVVKALYIKSWLEKNVYYTLKTKHIDSSDPTASFLFGSLRGYCVHIAHAAVYLLRSQGIAARVAMGYAVDNKLRDTGSAVLLLGSQEHAWPEIYVDGVGWVTFDIFPENGDEPPREFVDRDLESLFGELARNDKTGGKGDETRETTFEMPWDTLWKSLLAIVISALLACYIRKIIILIMAATVSSNDKISRALRGSIFVWSMYGHPWKKYSTLEKFADDTAGKDSATTRLISLSSCAKLGGKLEPSAYQKANELYKNSRKEAATHTPCWRKILGWINPIVRF